MGVLVAGMVYRGGGVVFSKRPCPPHYFSRQAEQGEIDLDGGRRRSFRYHRHERTQHSAGATGIWFGSTGTHWSAVKLEHYPRSAASSAAKCELDVGELAEPATPAFGDRRDALVPRPSSVCFLNASNWSAECLRPTTLIYSIRTTVMHRWRSSFWRASSGTA